VKISVMDTDVHVRRLWLARSHVVSSWEISLAGGSSRRRRENRSTNPRKGAYVFRRARDCPKSMFSMFSMCTALGTRPAMYFADKIKWVCQLFERVIG
jgi:hypothetical protein